MYSMVLIMAMSSTPATPAYQPQVGADHNQARYGNHLKTEQQRGGRGGGRRGGGGCCGCYGGGCYGGGCYGGCYGCWGGCYGCYGGCWGYARGGYYGGWASMPYSSGTYYGGTTYGYGAASMPGADGYRYDTGSERGRGDREMERGSPRDESRATAPATFVVRLPADARLMVNDSLTKSTSDTRTFVSPPLPTDETFTYTLKAEIMRDGKPVTVRRQITVRGGEETHVTLDFPESSLTRK